MEGFTYVDIFATKGIEYLLVISVLLLFIPFWRMVSRPAAAIYEAAEGIIPAISSWFHLPEEKIYYHQGHSWAMPEGDAGKGRDRRFCPEAGGADRRHTVPAGRLPGLPGRKGLEPPCGGKIHRHALPGGWESRCHQ